MTAVQRNPMRVPTDELASIGYAAMLEAFTPSRPWWWPLFGHGQHRAGKHSLRVADIAEQLQREEALRIALVTGETLAQRAIRYGSDLAGIGFQGLLDTFQPMSMGGAQR